MKKLILALTILPFSVSAGDEITDATIKNKFLTLVKDAEVEKMITGTSEFQSCRGEGFKASDTKPQRDAKLQAATTCFKSKITGKNPEALKKLSADLKLESYGLVKGKNVVQITDYLSKKMTKSLTGRDPDEKDPKKLIEQMKWENQKIVDHKVFIDLYTNQLTKSALFEVSRFCFENLRLKNTAATNFADHWQKMPRNTAGEPDISLIDDSGVPSFLSNSLTEDDLADPAKLTAGLTSGGAIDPDTYGKFFDYCQKALPVLCEDFKQKAQKKTKQDVTADLSGTVTTSGANACLTIDKLKSIRLTMKNTEVVEKQFKEMGEDKDEFALKLITSPKLYAYGNGKGEDSPDELTSYSSTDFMDKNKPKGDLDQMLKDCAKNPRKECDEYLVKGDSLDHAINNVETTMNLKKAIEIETVKALAQNKKTDELKKYLEENGHFEVLNKLNGNLANFDVVDELDKIFEARKVAEIENLKFKVGKRQISEADHSVLRQTAGAVEKKIEDNIVDAKQERARMAQVMMFNNIITSSLQLKTGTGANAKNVGRNVSGIKKELADLEKSKTYNKDLFKGVQTVADDQGSKLENTSVVGGTIIDSILGKKDD